MNSIEKKIVQSIDQFHEKRYVPREYLGLSEAGHVCPVWIWFRYNGFKKKNPSGRLLRLFELGHTIEDLVLQDLTDSGFKISDQQKEVVFTQDKLSIIGHIDGIITGINGTNQPYLWECKSINEKGFKALLFPPPPIIIISGNLTLANSAATPIAVSF